MDLKTWQVWATLCDWSSTDLVERSSLRTVTAVVIEAPKRVQYIIHMRACPFHFNWKWIIITLLFDLNFIYYQKSRILKLQKMSMQESSKWTKQRKLRNWYNENESKTIQFCNGLTFFQKWIFVFWWYRMVNSSGQPFK